MSKKAINQVKVLIGIFLLGIGLSGTKVLAADDEKGKKSNVGVSAVIPDNQIDKDKTFFDLLMQPGQEQELDINLSNSSDEEITVEVTANSAFTNDNGVIDYSPIKMEPDPTLKYPFSSISETPKEVVVPAQSKVVAKVKIKMPAESYTGVLAGGIHVTEKDKADKKEDSGGGVQIKNKFVYVVGVQLRTEESLEGLKGELALDKKKIIPTQVNYRNYLGINLQNTQPVYIRDLEVDAKIYRGNSDEVLHQTKTEKMKMAPNSNFNYGVDWENKPFQGGSYKAVVTAKSIDYGEEWSWTEEFTIDADLAKKLNDKAVELDKDNTQLIIMIVAGLGALLLVIIILIIVLNNRRQAKKRKARNSRKRKSSSSKSGSSKSSSSRKSRK